MTTNATRGWALDKLLLTPATRTRSICFCTLWPCDFGLWHLTPKSYVFCSVGYPKVISYTKFEYFGIIRFWVIARTNRQTEWQTDEDHRLTHATIIFSKSNACIRFSIWNRKGRLTGFADAQWKCGQNALKTSSDCSYERLMNCANLCTLHL